MLRRIFISEVKPGRIRLGQREMHHLRDVLRMGEKDAIEVFDDRGRAADAIISVVNSEQVCVDIAEVRKATKAGALIVVASAVPRGNRADWMIEKLAELGVNKWIPLDTERGVVKPKGTEKKSRWERIAIEAARQSGSKGVMSIAPAATPREAIERAAGATVWHLSLEANATPVRNAMIQGDLLLMIGPEGGWTAGEMALLRQSGAAEISLGPTVLRVETAAVAAAAVARALSADIG